LLDGNVSDFVSMDTVRAVERGSQLDRSHDATGPFLLIGGEPIFEVGWLPNIAPPTLHPVSWPAAVCR
jgi:hypothetical protein